MYYHSVCMCVRGVMDATDLHKTSCPGHDVFLIRYEKCGNEELALSLAQWVFKKRGMLRYSDVKHHKQGHSEPPAAYTITDDVVGYFWLYPVMVLTC